MHIRPTQVERRLQRSTYSFSFEVNCRHYHVDATTFQPIKVRLHVGLSAKKAIKHPLRPIHKEILHAEQFALRAGGKSGSALRAGMGVSAYLTTAKALHAGEQARHFITRRDTALDLLLVDLA